MKCPRCLHEMENETSSDGYCPRCNITWNRIDLDETEIPIRIDKSKAETVDWLTNGLSDKALEREQKKWERQDARVEKKLKRQHARRQKKIDKERAKHHINDCPCCGEPRPAVAYGITDHEYWIECQKCYAASKERRTLRGAIKEWNKIVPHDGIGIL